MTDEEKQKSPFSREERATLHTLAYEFKDKADLERLRNVLREGATITLLVQAYRTQKNTITFLKGTAGLIIVIGGAWAVIKGLWPK